MATLEIDYSARWPAPLPPLIAQTDPRQKIRARVRSYARGTSNLQNLGCSARCELPTNIHSGGALAIAIRPGYTCVAFKFFRPRAIETFRGPPGKLQPIGVRQ
jgi:hypothetical protein